MEANLTRRKQRLKLQLPDITSSIAMIEKLRAKTEAKEVTDTQFLLSDSVYASAKIPHTDKVSLALTLSTFKFNNLSLFEIGLSLAWSKCDAGIQF